MKFYSKTHKEFYLNVLDGIRDYYGNNLISLIVYGSYSRGENMLNSDLDLIMILEKVKSRRGRIEEFTENIESKLDNLPKILYEEGISSEVSPFILSKEEASYFNTLYVDIVNSNIIVYDKDNFMADILTKSKKLMKEWGTKKEFVGSQEVIILKKDYSFGGARLG